MVRPPACGMTGRRTGWGLFMTYGAGGPGHSAPGQPGGVVFRYRAAGGGVPPAGDLVGFGGVLAFAQGSSLAAAAGLFPATGRNGAAALRGVVVPCPLR